MGTQDLSLWWRHKGFGLSSSFSPIAFVDFCLWFFWLKKSLLYTPFLKKFLYPPHLPYVSTSQFCSNFRSITATLARFGWCTHILNAEVQPGNARRLEIASNRCRKRKDNVSVHKTTGCFWLWMYVRSIYSPIWKELGICNIVVNKITNSST